MENAMQRYFLLSQACAFATVLLWSSAYVFTKVALEQYSVAALALLRCAVAAICLGAALAVKRSPFPGLAALPRFCLAGAAGFALYTLAFNKGSASLNPTTSCIIIATSPIITALLAQLRFKERLSLRKWLAIALAFCGILLMTLWDGVFAVSEGMPWMLLAALLISIYNILQRSLSRRFTPLLVTAYSFFAGAALLMPFLPEAVRQLGAAPPGQAALVLFLGAGPSAAAYLLWTKALSIAPKTSSVSNYMFLTPFLALLLEYAVTGKLPGAATFAGGGVIIAGLLVFILADRKK